MLLPSGKSDQEREKNQQAWKGYRIELASQAPLREDIDSRRVVWSLAASPASRGDAVGKGDISVVLRDGAGQEMARTSVPLLRLADASPPRE